MPFEDDLRIKNIEIGAGCGIFGKKYFAECYLTDNNQELNLLCEDNSIDVYCDAHHLPWGNDRFDKIIVCNPFSYGFRNSEVGSKILTELTRVAKSGGEIIVLAAEQNPWGTSANVTKRVREFNDSTPTIMLESESENIDPATEFKDYVFYLSDKSNTTRPTQKTIIKINKTSGN